MKVFPDGPTGLLMPLMDIEFSPEAEVKEGG